MDNKSKTHSNYKNNWGTPDTVFSIIYYLFGKRFVLDVAATEENKKCLYFISPEMDALSIDWNFDDFLGAHEQFKFIPLWWCNPPFMLVEAFLRKAYEQFTLFGREGIMLVPSSWETEWFRTWITEKNMPRLIWPKRIEFIDPDTGMPKSGNTSGSVLVAFVKDRSTLPEILGQPWLVNL